MMEFCVFIIFVTSTIGAAVVGAIGVLIKAKMNPWPLALLLALSIWSLIFLVTIWAV